MNKNDKIFVAGHKGMVGSAIVRELLRQGYTNLVLRTHAELDLTRQTMWKIFLKRKSRDMYF
ncbi:GDP-L-fucose synthase [Eubacterium plexicaudatum ASF492]|nr:GDP-L-fucose synthase [Eubacterium plexicaudatum ASF492]